MYPTMEDIMSLAELKQLTILAGEAGLSHKVSYVTVMDNAEIVYWMEEYEILLTNGYFLKDYTITQMIAFLDSLIRKKSAGIFIKVDKHLKALPEELLMYANQQGFLLVEVPNELSWTDISEPVTRYINQIQFYFVHQAMEFRDQLMSLSLSGGSIGELCDVAEGALKKPVAIYRHDFKLLAASAGFHSDLLTPSLRMRMKHRHTLPVEETIKYENYSLVSNGERIYLFPINHGKEELGSIVVEAVENQPIVYSDITKIDQFVILAAYEISKALELNRLEKRYYSEFITNLLEGDLTDKKTIMEHGLNLGKEVFDEYVVCLFEKKGNLTLEQQFEKIQGKIQTPSLINKLFYAEKNEHFVFLIPWIEAVSREGLKKIMNELISSHPQIIAISSVTPVTALEKAYQEALFAYSCHVIFSHSCIAYEDTGLLPLLVTDKNKLNGSFIDSYYEKNMQPVVSYDQTNGTDLLKTMLTFVHCNFNISQAATQLYIHENTMRFRVKRIEELTQKEFNKSEDMFQLMLACYIHFVKQGKP